MINNRLNSKRTAQGGFTLVELLVVIGIIAILAGVALGPITKGIKQSQESTAMQTCRQIGLMEFAYSNDYNQTYPYAASGHELASLLVNGNYASDPSVFYIASTPGATKAAVATPYVLKTTDVSYDFLAATGATTPGGLTASASDGTPVVMQTGSTGFAMAVTGPIDCNIDATKTAFGTDGIAVCYKSNSAKFQKAVITGANAAKITAFVDSSYNDPSGASYGLLTR